MAAHSNLILPGVKTEADLNPSNPGRRPASPLSGPDCALEVGFSASKRGGPPHISPLEYRILGAIEASQGLQRAFAVAVWHEKSYREGFETIPFSWASSARESGSWAQG